MLEVSVGAVGTAHDTVERVFFKKKEKKKKRKEQKRKERPSQTPPLPTGPGSTGTAGPRPCHDAGPSAQPDPVLPDRAGPCRVGRTPQQGRLARLCCCFFKFNLIFFLNFKF